MPSTRASREVRNRHEEFIAKHHEQIIGVLSGFDRLVFRGTLRGIAYAAGMRRYLNARQVLLKDFGQHVAEVSERLKAASLAEARVLGRAVMHLVSSKTDKDTTARRIMADEGIARGLVCVLSCVEPCQSFEIHRDRELQKLVLEPRRRKCLFLYHYWVHPRFGFMHARIQTWFPFSIQHAAMRSGTPAAGGVRKLCEIWGPAATGCGRVVLSGLLSPSGYGRTIPKGPV